jgi:NADPH2:quinone reductase
MRAIEITKPGGPEVLQLVQRPDPTPGPGEVLIKVSAAGVNRLDVLQRKGVYPPPLGASDLPGVEVAGKIVGGEPQAGGFKCGDQVCALITGGGYAEYVVVPVVQCLPVPAGLSAIQAASLPETYFTVWSNVFERGRLAPGETLLVHGGASGIGTTAILLARAFGSKVYATVGSDDRAKVVCELGADAGINYQTEDFVERIKALTHHKGVNVILDMVAGKYLERDLECLANDGCIVVIALQGGSTATVSVDQILRRRLTITGSSLRAREIDFKAGIARTLRAKVWPLFENGTLQPVVYATFPLQEACRAHTMMEAGKHIGKIILTL